MNALTQFLNLLDEKIVDNDELKTELTTAFTKVQSTFDTTKDRADKLGSKADDLAKLTKIISTKLGIEEIDEDNISQAIESMSKNKDVDIEALKTDLATRHEADLKTLREEITLKDASIADLNKANEDNIFKNSVLDKGYLDVFTPDQEYRNLVISKAKNDLLYRDGDVYAKDSITGDILKDPQSGEPLKADYVFNQIASKTNPSFLSADVKSQGGGVPPPNQTSTSSTQVDTSKHTSVNGFMKEAMASIAK